MPTYDYCCEKCNHQFEVFQSITADPIKQCPECGGKVRRLIGGGNGLIFKGSGFYITDYKKSNGSGTTSNSKPSEPSKKAEAPKGSSDSKSTD